MFDLHRDPGLFEELTPPGLADVTIPHTGGIEPGSEVVLRVTHPLVARLLPNVALPGFGCGPVGIPWRVRHVLLEPPHRFEDVQVSGPFAHWHHHHVFTTPEPGRTRITDVVEWEVSWILTPAAPVIRWQLGKLFSYRERALTKLLAGDGWNELLVE